MVLKIVASHGTHYKDGVFNVALWSQPLFAWYVGEAPFGAYTTEADEELRKETAAGEITVNDVDTVIPHTWPEVAGDVGEDPIPVRGISYHSTRANGEQKELYVSVDCSVYLMTDEGKTIERLI